MKHLVFDELLLLSLEEKGARRVRFDEKLTVIQGENDRGKSSIIKTLYRALGGVPPNIHPDWESAQVKALVRFRVADQAFQLLYDGGTYTIFDSSGSLQERFTSVTRGLGPFMARVCDFHLQLKPQRAGGETQGTPAFLYLPFYFDQDQSWTSNWSGFTKLSQFKTWKPDVAAFHAGIRPSEYYVAKAKGSEAQEKQEPLRAQRALNQAMKDRVRRKLALVSFDVDIAVYQGEVEQLLEHCNVLAIAEETLKEGLVEAFNSKYVIELQLKIARAAAEELKLDHDFAARQDDPVTCPICQADYVNSFAERFSIAADEDGCLSLVGQLATELEVVNTKIEKLQGSSEAASSTVAEIKALLDTKRQEIKLRDLIEKEGHRALDNILQGEIDELNRQLGELDDEIQTAEEEMKDSTDKKRARRIREFYRSTMKKYLAQLDVRLPENSYKRIDASIKEMGSDLPRALLAYYFAFLQTVSRYSTSTFCPIVIDSPRTQDQDATNWERMLSFIRDEQPKGSQMIVSFVDDLGVELGGERVEVTQKRQVLQYEEFESVAAEMRPFLELSLEA